MQQTMQTPEPATPGRPSTRALLRYFLYLGSLGFGGPVALVGYMQRDLVERRRWFTKEEYVKSLALSQLAPGPLAAQLAICLGYVHSTLRGATGRRAIVFREGNLRILLRAGVREAHARLSPFHRGACQ